LYRPHFLRSAGCAGEALHGGGCELHRSRSLATTPLGRRSPFRRTAAPKRARLDPGDSIGMLADDGFGRFQGRQLLMIVFDRSVMRAPRRPKPCSMPSFAPTGSPVYNCVLSTRCMRTTTTSPSANP